MDHRRAAARAAASSGACSTSSELGDGGSTRCIGMPSTATKAVRSASCRSVTSPNAAASASGSSAPVTRNATARAYAPAGPGSPSDTASWSVPATLPSNVAPDPAAPDARIHSRRWADVSGCSSPGVRGRSGASPSAPKPTSPAAVNGNSGRRAASRTACPAIVGAANTAESGSSVSNRSRMAASRRTARRLWPPMVKKSSSRPTAGKDSTSHQISWTARSSVPRGKALAPGARRGTGRASRSSLPFGVSGKASSVHEIRGHHVLRQHGAKACP